jgi:FG-GAP-like repeat/FG-GAP repeat
VNTLPLRYTASCIVGAAANVAAVWPKRFSRHANAIAVVLALGALLGATQPAAAQFSQQGAKLVGTGIVGSQPQQGNSVALSADGNTMIEGAPGDNGGVGAAWVFSRSGGVWTQQAKIVPSDAADKPPAFGTSVALSADGNTAIIGGPKDGCTSNPCYGSGWVFTRSGSTWSEQQKVPGVNFEQIQNDGLEVIGNSVSMSADGNTATAGGVNNPGAEGPMAGVFVRHGTIWVTQQIEDGPNGCAQHATAVAMSGDGQTMIMGAGTSCSDSPAGEVVVLVDTGGGFLNFQATLEGTGSSASAAQGFSVALSYDGNTALVGGPGDNSSAGATWVFTRSGGVWSQQAQLVGNGGTPGSGLGQGSSVALSADGNTAISGAANDNSGSGAAWIFSRTGGVWSQRGSKLVGTGVTNGMGNGMGVALSGDGNTAVVGNPGDSGGTGATWVFTRTVPTNTHDYDDSGVSDIAWRDTAGDIAIWQMNGATVTSSLGIGTVPTTWSIVGQRDFDGDGTYDLLWRDTSGNTAIWFMNGTNVASTAAIGNIPATWSVTGTGDFNGDGRGDILWQDTSGNVAVWLMNGASVLSSAGFGNVPSAVWSLAGTGDFNGDGKTDLLWRNTAGDVWIWFVNGTSAPLPVFIGNVPSNFTALGTGDFNGDGMSDILWRENNTGGTAIWLMDGMTVSSGTVLGTVPSIWSVAATGDYNGDGLSDILWRDTSGNIAMWFMNGTTVSSTAGVGNIPAIWTVQSISAE